MRPARGDADRSTNISSNKPHLSRPFVLGATDVPFTGSLRRKQMDVAVFGPIFGVDLAASFLSVVGVGEKNSAASFDRRLGQCSFVSRGRRLPRQKAENHLRLFFGVDEERRRDGKGVESQVPSGVEKFIGKSLFLLPTTTTTTCVGVTLARLGTSEHFP